MTWTGKLAALLPAVFLFIIGYAVMRLLLHPGGWELGELLFVLYAMPLIVFRVHDLFFPLRQSITNIGLREYSPWWTSHQIQMIYIAFPMIEAPLHLVPGVFSLWLRLWGSRIGKGVYWTPKVEVIDRSLLDIGDGVIVGHLTAFCGHAISPVNGTLSLIVQKIEVGPKSFIGAESRLGPGSKVAAGELVKAQSSLYWKGVLR